MKSKLMRFNLWSYIFPVAALMLTLHEPVRASNLTEVPREIVSIYFNAKNDDPRLTLAHQYGEVILNHLGLTVRHHNLRNGLPSLQDMENIRGILAWFDTTAMTAPNDFLNWAIQHVERGKRLVLLGYPAFVEDLEGRKTPIRLINKLMKHLGLKYDDAWVPFTYDLKVLNQSALFTTFEGPLPNPMPPFFSMQAMSPQANVVLSVVGRRKAAPHVLASLSSMGGYAAEGYILNLNKNHSHADQAYWILNPLTFFRSAFGTDEIPKADTTTLMGQRIFYSQVDGDGWNQISDIKDLQQKPFTAAEIILDRVIAAFPSLPVTVAPIAADLHSDWRGTKKAREVARKLFTYPHVEVGTHTFTHPYVWGFYEDYAAATEAPYRWDYSSVVLRLKNILQCLLFANQERRAACRLQPVLEDTKPRAYLDAPFSLATEISEAVAFIESFAPRGKKVKILQWTGDTKPFERALAEVESLGISNINGGRAKLDALVPSLASLSSVGLRLKQHVQIYSSNGDERSYASVWAQPSFGVRHLKNMLHKTESPVRIKPFNLYYHMSDGVEGARLNAIRNALDWAKSMPITPVTASHYARIGKGFFSTRFMSMGKRQWKILGRHALQTIRFDNAVAEAVDFDRSLGIIGQNYYQKSLYVSLDGAVKEPILALKTMDQTDKLPIASRPYLMNSSWRIWDFQEKNKNSFSFSTQGFGDGKMEWWLPTLGIYEVIAQDENGNKLEIFRNQTEDDESLKIKTNEDGYLRVKIDNKSFIPMIITVKAIGS